MAGILFLIDYHGLRNCGQVCFRGAENEGRVTDRRILR